MVILVLALIWVLALTPLAIRQLSAWQLTSSIERFRLRSRVLSQNYLFTGAAAPVERVGERVLAGPRRPAPSRARRAEVRARRRRALAILGGAWSFVLLLSAVTGLTAMWLLFGLVSAALVCYLALLVKVAANEASRFERARKVVPLAPHLQSPALYDERAAAAGAGGASYSSPLAQRPAFVLVEAP